MDLTKILSELEAEKDQIVRAIKALAGIGSSKGSVSLAKGTKRGPGRPKGSHRKGAITPEGRRRLSLAMKKRWAERRRKTS